MASIRSADLRGLGGRREARDHPRHRSLWMTHGDIKGVDFWRALDPQPKVVHDALLRGEIENGVGVVQARNRWVAPDGRVHCTDTRMIRFSTRERARMIDYAVSLRASQGPFSFGVNEEGMMANPRHPTWWHARDYGLITANPSGGHDRYRFVFHEGDFEQAQIARRYEEYASAP